MKLTHYFNISLALVLFCLSAVPAQAQNKITFDKLSHDFGVFSEDSDLQSCTFKVTNHQAQPIAISHVQSSCGCAIPQYTRKAIQPGGTGEIKIIYNPQGRPGKFNRTIVVSFSGQSQKVHLFIKGTVTPGVVRKDKSYPYVMGDLQLRTTRLKLKPMQSGIQQQRILVVNSGDTPLRIEFSSTLSSISATLSPDVLQPKQKGEIRIVRRTDKDSNRTCCVVLKENARQNQSAGKVSISIHSEKCQ